VTYSDISVKPPTPIAEECQLSAIGPNLQLLLVWFRKLLLLILASILFPISAVRSHPA
jgi:hypothetical protein